MTATRVRKPKPALDDDELAKLRRAVGIPESGPTPEMLQAWGEEVRRPAVVDEHQADEVVQLRDRVSTVQQAFAIILNDRDQLARQLVNVTEDRDRLAGLLEEAGRRIDEMQRQVEDVIATADQLVDRARAEDREAARHRHAWEVQPGLKAMPLPCACGRPWPRNRPPDTVAVGSGRQRVEFLKPHNASADQHNNTPEGQ